MVLPVPLRGSGDSDGALLVKSGDTGASIRIWRAMTAGRPVVYPEGSAYYEQVFHAGLPYTEESDATLLMRIARDNAGELHALAKLPAEADLRRFLKMLLRG